MLSGINKPEKVLLRSPTIDRPQNPATPPPPPVSPDGQKPMLELTKRDYFAVHLYQAAVANLSQKCSLRDKAGHVVAPPSNPGRCTVTAERSETA